MDKYEKAKIIYREIRKILQKNKNIFDAEIIKAPFRKKLFKLMLECKYGINVNEKSINMVGNFFDTVTINKYVIITYFDDNYKRIFYYKYPKKGKLYLMIIFYEHNDIYKKFWEQLKNYKPNYINEEINLMLWEISRAKEVYKTFAKMLKIYKKLK